MALTFSKWKYMQTIYFISNFLHIYKKLQSPFTLRKSSISKFLSFSLDRVGLKILPASLNSLSTDADEGRAVLYRKNNRLKIGKFKIDSDAADPSLKNLSSSSVSRALLGFKDLKKSFFAFFLGGWASSLSSLSLSGVVALELRKKKSKQK